MEQNKILSFNDICEMLTGGDPPKYRKIGNVKWVKIWKDGRSLYSIGQLENEKYFWAWNIEGRDLPWEGILQNLDDGENNFWYGTGGFIYKTIKQTLKSIQFDEMFDEELFENEGLTQEQWKDHPFYIWAKEQFEQIENN
jgi:hypothetical protein